GAGEEGGSRQPADPGGQSGEEEAFRSADRVYVVSPALLRYARAVAPGVPARWIPNGADIEAFRRAELAAVPGLDGRLVVGFTGSMKPWHGVADLLEAFARVLAPAAGYPPGGREPVLLLVGDGP